jgi:hypothetical protein
MVAAVSPSALSSDTFRQTQLDNQERDKLTLVNICSSTMGARKRRRQILLSQRQGKSDLSKFLQGEMEQPSIRAQTQNEGTCEEESSASDIPSPKLEAVSPAESGHEDEVASPVIVQDVKSGKKPQMRYEPSVPMTKEQAAAWRREQRRKRNRESAAASRQRQRDRISELEKEVMDWKDKFQSAVDRLNKLEALLGQELTRYEPDGVSSPHLPSDTLTKRRKVDMAEETSKAVSPCPSPDLSPMSTRTVLSSCPTLSTSTFGLPKNVESEATSLCTPLEIVNEHSKENKSLPA